MTTTDRRLELLNAIFNIVREAVEPPQWQMAHPGIRRVEVQFDRRDWLRLKAIIAELEAIQK